MLSLKYYQSNIEFQWFANDLILLIFPFYTPLNDFGVQTFISPARSSSSSWGIPRPTKPDGTIPPALCGSACGLLLVGCAQNVFIVKHPGGILIECPNLSWVLSLIQGSSSPSGHLSALCHHSVRKAGRKKKRVWELHESQASSLTLGASSLQ